MSHVDHVKEFHDKLWLAVMQRPQGMHPALAFIKAYEAILPEDYWKKYATDKALDIVESFYVRLKARDEEIKQLKEALDTAHKVFGAECDAMQKRHEVVDRDKVWKLRNEVDCRIDHGANSNGHLEYVRKILDEVLHVD